MKKDQEKEKKSRKTVAYVGFTLRILVGIFAIAIAVVFSFGMFKTASTRTAYVVSFLAPILAVSIVFGDLYMHYKLDIKPFRKKSDQKTNPLEFK